MRMLLPALLVVSMVLSIETSASAHGGSYRGPAGEVPPGQRDPSDPQPPPQSPTPATPPRDGSSTQPPDNGTPTDPGETGGTPPGSPRPRGDSGPAAGPPNGGGVRTPRPRPRARPCSFENWLFWWHYNKDEFLNLKAAVRRREARVRTGGSVRCFGDEFPDNRGEVETATDAQVRKHVVPAIHAVLRDAGFHDDIRGGALIALARCGATKESARTFMTHAGSRKLLVRESALLALGIMQLRDRAVLDFLADYVDETGHPVRSRCFAAVSLGLLEDTSRETWMALKRCLGGRESHADMAVCALIAIGLIGDAERRDELVGWLEGGKIDGEPLDDLRRSHVVAALGRMGDPASLPAVSRLLGKSRPFSRRSAVIALGQLIPQASENVQIDCIDRLARYLAGEKDQTARNFGLIALGRIGGRATASAPVRAACARHLIRAFERGNRVTERPFAALGLGVLCFPADRKDARPDVLTYRIAERIRKDLGRLRGDKHALAAQAIALGLIGRHDAETVDLLIRILEDRTEGRKLRGSSAMALGLIGDRKASRAIIDSLGEKEDRTLRVDTAIAAGLIGDSDAVLQLVRTLNDTESSQFVLGSVALALGQIGDHQAIVPLVRILEPDNPRGNYPDLTRALVTVALGQIADRRDTRVLFRISKDVNYRASLAALDELLTIL